MELQTCIRTRRSVRQFTDEPVSHAALEQVIALAAWAPSWKNTQISRYMAIEDPEVLQTICAQYVSPFNARIIGGCKTLIAQTFVKSRSGFERDGSFSKTAGSTTTAAWPPRPCAWPPTTWAWAPW